MVCIFSESNIATDSLLPIATIMQLALRKQRYKLRMFTWLYRLLLFTVLMVAIFFIVSSMTFSGRLAIGKHKSLKNVLVLNDHCNSDYGARSWKVQWWLLDGWLSLLYLIDFVAVAYLWRPTPNNRR